VNSTKKDLFFEAIHLLIHFLLGRKECLEQSKKFEDKELQAFLNQN